MKFKYTATNEEGKIIEGTVDFATQSEVLVYLAQKNLKPISISMAEERLSKIKLSFGSSINITDQIFLSKYFSLMLRVGADLLKVIDIMIADFSKPALRRFLSEVKEALQSGKPFHSAFLKYSNYFSPVFVNLVKAGEKSGNLDMVFESLSNALERERNFRDKIFAAMVYPIFLVVIGFFIMLFLIGFALPRVSGVFASSGFSPPTFSRVVFAVGGFLSNYILYIGFGSVFIILFLYYFTRFTKPGRAFLRRFVSLIPVVSNLYKKISLQQLTSTLSLLMKSGLPILESLKIVSNVVTYPGMPEALRRVSDEGVAKGQTLGASFHREGVFPQLLSNLITISEKSGNIEELLDTLSRFYESEVDVSMKKVVSFVEPMMLLVIGGAVGLVALSIILPVYQLVGQF